MTAAQASALAECRRQLSEVAPEASSPREAGILLGRRVAQDLDHLWEKSDCRDGPIEVVDFFSGCGGMSAGFRAVNAVLPAFRLLAAVDNAERANATYERNLGLTPVNADVADLARSPRKVRRLLTERDRTSTSPLVMIGCAPCQGFSSHRKAAGRQSDPRNTLFVDFARIAAETGPDVVIAENVPELFSERYWPVVEEARRVLEASGYSVHLSVHNMAAFSVPQERFRALLLAMKKDVAPPVGFLPRAEYRTVREAIGWLPQVSAGQRIEEDPMHFSARHQASTIEVLRAVPKDGGSRPADVGPECLRRSAERNGKPSYEDVYGRLAWDRPAITLTAYARNPASGRFAHPEQDRGLTIREAANLQGFPSGYHFEGTLDDAFRQIGNAVPPRFSGYLAASVLGQLLDPSVKSIDHCGVTAPVGRSFSRLIPSLKSLDAMDLTAALQAR